ncbi:MAG TPA: secretin N-terminal domain-containing protein, partial [Kofleriaceae bacterium]|nr:secretin N-terminal domain-containing protein [Kofleriaceae bacterium]
MRLLLIFALVIAFQPRVVRADSEHPDDTSVLSCSKKVGEVAITFKPDIEVKELITWAMGFTCNKYMYDMRFVQNRHVTVMAPERMSPHDAYELFLGSLATAGLAVVRKGDAWVIVESQAAKREAVPFVQHPGDGNDVVRFVLRPAYAKPETMAAAFESLKSDAGEIKQLGSVLVITDYARHVKEMVALAKQIDVAGGSDGMFMIPVLHADATKLKAKLDDILGTAAPAKPDQPQPKILVDERTNTLIVAGPQAVFERVQALVDRLDISLDIEGGASIHVYQLGNAVAEE